MVINENNEDLFSNLVTKASLKQNVYSNTLTTFTYFKSAVRKIVDEYKKRSMKEGLRVPIEYIDKGEFEIELKFAGDVLIFVMHTNIFEFSRYHEVMTTSYVKEDKLRSYCGIINIYNFLADSFKYNRVNDIGYMIGRVFVNKDMHYFIEGKRELGFLYNNFGNAIMDKESAKSIIKSAILYTINFDLLTPPYEEVKAVSVYDMQTTLDNMQIKTGKRLGFRFQADEKMPPLE